MGIAVVPGIDESVLVTVVVSAIVDTDKVLTVGVD